MSVLNPAAGRALSTEAIIEAGVAELYSARERGERSRVLAGIVFAVFEDYYLRSRRMPWLAKAAFEARDWPATAQLSRDRLSIYSISTRQRNSGRSASTAHRPMYSRRSTTLPCTPRRRCATKFTRARPK